MPPERSATSEPGRLSVGFDATALLGRPTGVGAFCAGALAALGERDDVAVSAFAVSWRRRRGIEHLLPRGIASGQRPMPARPLHAAWRRWNLPPVEWFTGPCDVVHGPNFVVPPTRRAARVVSVWDLTVVLYPELCDGPTLEYPRAIRRAAGAGAWVHVATRFIADQVIAELSVDPERVRVVPLGVPAPTNGTVTPPPPGQATPPQSGPATWPPSGPPHEAGGRPPVGLPPGCSRYVLAVGTVEPRKDYPLLVSAFAAATTASPDVALVIVGNDGWGADRLAAALDGSPARDRILRTGYVDDRLLEAILHGAALLAYPSLYEGFGFPPLQAMAAGVPVVATAAGAVPEVAGDAAVLVAPGDEDALAAALMHVLEGGADVEELVARGLRRSREFSWDACADGLVRLYADAAAGAARGPRPAAHRRAPGRGGASAEEALGRKASGRSA